MRIVHLVTAAVVLIAAAPAAAFHESPGNAGATKVDLYDNTQDRWNVNTADPVTGGADPVIGFVNYRPTTPDDPRHAVFVVAVKDAAPNCTLRIDLVTGGLGSGLQPDSGHTGFINPIGTLTTDGNGKANSGEITVDVSELGATAPSGEISAAHIDLEAVSGCTEDDGTPVDNNEYGASGAPDGYAGAAPLPDQIHWRQP